MAPGQQPNTTASGWTVTGQTPTTELGSDGRALRGYRIHFQTRHGVSGSVFVSEQDYNPVNVKAQIADLVAQLDQVSQLSG